MATSAVNLQPEGHSMIRISMIRISSWIVAGTLTLTAILARAEVGDPTIRTDHPQYAGEGAFQTIEDCASFATAGAHAPQDKAIAMYLWLLTHQWHLASPQEFNVPGAKPDTQKSDAYDLMVFDANRARFSYGYGLCGTVHAWNEPYWKALGMNARRRAFPGHTNSEIEYDGGWHAFDTDMAGLIFRPDGVVAGYADIVKDPDLAQPRQAAVAVLSLRLARRLSDDARRLAGSGQRRPLVPDVPRGYAAHPGVVHLRRGETFTRYFDRDHFGGPSKRRFWHHQSGGPFRDWTFANQGQPQHDGSQAATAAEMPATAMASSSIGRIWRSEPIREGVVATATNLAHGRSSPRLPSDGQDASRRHVWPLLALRDLRRSGRRRQSDDRSRDRRAGRCRPCRRRRATGDLGRPGTDLARRWRSSAASFERDLTDLVKGRYGWQARF